MLNLSWFDLKQTAPFFLSVKVLEDVMCSPTCCHTGFRWACRWYSKHLSNFLSYLICFTYMPYCFICLYSLYDMLLLFYWIFFGDVCCEHMCRLLVLVCINKHTLAAIFPPLPISSYWPVKNCISSCVRLDGMLLMDWPTCVLCSFHVSYNAV